MPRSILITTVIAIALISTAQAAAHAIATQRVPAANSTLQRAPTAIAVTFNEDVSGGVDAIRLVDGNGALLSGPATVTGAKISAPLAELAPGRYLYTTSIVSADGHAIRTGIAFAVGVATPAARPLTVRLGHRHGRLSGNRVGLRTLTLPPGLWEGSVQWVPTTIGVPLTWPLSGGRATGMLPFAGTYDLIVRAKRGALSETVLTGAVRISP